MARHVLIAAARLLSRGRRAHDCLNIFDYIAARVGIRVGEHTHLAGVAARTVCRPKGCRGGYMADVHVYIYYAAFTYT